MDVTIVPTPKTVLLCITVDEDNVIIASPADGTPRRIKSLDQLVELVRDPQVQPAKSTAAGFDMGDMFRGIGRALAELGKPDEKEGSDKR